MNINNNRTVNQQTNGRKPNDEPHNEIIRLFPFPFFLLLLHRFVWQIKGHMVRITIPRQVFKTPYLLSSQFF